MNDIHAAELAGNETAKRRRMPWWGWVLGALCVLVGVPICIMIAALLYIGVVSPELYIGVVGPDRSVYPGRAVPQRFISEMKDLGVLGEDEEVLYFYSDALIDIRDGFYFVSDRGVVVYSEMREGDPLVIYEFDEIDDVLLDRDEFNDSIVTIYAHNDESIEFPVSSEYNRDEDFFEAISLRLRPSESSDVEIDDWQLDDDV